ncbi:hypothetical protein HDU93_009585 [Gonapodya sp. JEL0774]|nr:hypothetical protein HDU93_009585 [Gonapodya sp. JEL0774]
MAIIERALGNSKTILNVGAGAGSYEPWETRKVTAVEPSSAMREQRPPHLTRAVDGVAQALPFDDLEFDAAMSTFSIHQWPDVEKGLSEMMRVTKGTIVLLTCDPDLVPKIWLSEYTGGMTVHEAGRFPAISKLKDLLGKDGATVEVLPVPIPLHCTDGFIEAYYGRPEMFLEEGVRRAQSSWSFMSREQEVMYMDTLRAALESGEWDKKYGHLRTMSECDWSLRLVVARK